jgi:alpha-beta hydrolase superfamily lysophospholipase
VFNRIDAQALRESLPEFDPRAKLQTSEALTAYLQYYGLDTQSLCPDNAHSIHHAMGVLTCAGFRIACHYYSPPQERIAGTVVLVHGYYDHVGLYTHLLRYCLALNLAVFAFDLPGHGLSNGEPAAIDSFSQYTAVFEECLRHAQQLNAKEPLHIVAQSTGCAIVMDYCLRHCSACVTQIEQIVLLAPLVRPMAWRRGELTYVLVRRFIKSIKRTFVINSHDEQFLQFLRERDPLQAKRLPVSWVGALRKWLKDFERYTPCNKSVNIVQGTEDDTVDWRYNLVRIKEKFPNSEVNLLSDARHHLANESEMIRDDLCRILDRFLKTKPDSE